MTRIKYNNNVGDIASEQATVAYWRDRALSAEKQIAEQLSLFEERIETNRALVKENLSLRTQYDREVQSSAKMNEEYTKMLAWQDLVVRTFRNQNMSPIYQKLYIGLVDVYPHLLEGGDRVPIEVWKVREAAGWVSEASATNFFQDVPFTGAFVYDPGKPAKKGEVRYGFVTPDPEIFPCPEIWDTKNAEKRRKARDAEEKKRKQYKHALQILQCEMCGATEITNDVVATCKKCHHKHAPLLNIPSSMMMIEPEVVEVADEQPLNFSDDEYTGFVGTSDDEMPDFVQETLPESLPPNPDGLCIKCKRPRRVCFTFTADGGWWNSCSL